jgi:hypothetical protein
LATDETNRSAGERYTAHVLLPGGAVAALTGGGVVAWSEPASDLPSIALGSPVVLAAEIALALSYGGMLVFLPGIRGMLSGEWPIEVSARGARFQEAVTGQLLIDEALVR